MPNWCSNSFTVTGAQPEIDHLTALIMRENHENHPDKGDGLILDFNGLVPVPEALAKLDYHALNLLMIVLARAEPDTLLPEVLKPDRTGPTRLLAEKLAEDFPGWQEMTADDLVGRLNADSELAERYDYQRDVFESARTCQQAFGEMSAYAWRTKHWGVGREAFYCRVSPAPGKLTVSFESAWCPPEGFYRALVEGFPTLDFEAIYLKESNGVAGRYRNEGAVLIDEQVSDNGRNIRQFAIEVFGYEYGDEEDDDE
ncbi:hypothetical protein EGK75_13520 [Neisseria weixii]|uniref:YubB ferredoxin-like domain-containing protein n=1 Tax=Neisseria weixii TaxID=1853276 RepID=A0A3N4MN79_9NEIS|nr:hypothetical protein [Neisseria weixii]RPD83107.1 hypothetical protein EGK74_13475 [Neisseria weixii]RPD83267.1 hypothetical protein EGK75_13520 [Neisseria weixii]